jgi:hypothetical protein
MEKGQRLVESDTAKRTMIDMLDPLLEPAICSTPSTESVVVTPTPRSIASFKSTVAFMVLAYRMSVLWKPAFRQAFISPGLAQSTFNPAFWIQERRIGSLLDLTA